MLWDPIRIFEPPGWWNHSGALRQKLQKDCETLLHNHHGWEGEWVRNKLWQESILNYKLVNHKKIFVHMS